MATIEVIEACMWVNVRRNWRPSISQLMHLARHYDGQMSYDTFEDFKKATKSINGDPRRVKVRIILETQYLE